MVKKISGRLQQFYAMTREARIDYDAEMGEGAWIKAVRNQGGDWDAPNHAPPPIQDPGDGDDGTGLGLPLCVEAQREAFSADITAVVPWYGSNRTLASKAGEAIGDVDVCFITFAGSLTEVPYIKVRQITANDKHEDLIRLVKVIRDPVTGPQLQAELRSAVFHETELREAQDRIRSARLGAGGIFKAHEYETDLARARDYFITAWMGQSSNVGTEHECTGNIAVRWTGSGGGSAKRFKSAVDAICPAWADAFRRCEFVCQDYLQFHARVIATIERQRAEYEQWKREKHPSGQFKAPTVDRVAVYMDPPFPGPGDRYLHPFNERDHRVLSKDAHKLVAVGARVVMRFYDHPLVRELYPEAFWDWRHLSGGRDQNNAEKPEVLLVSRIPAILP